MKRIKMTAKWFIAILIIPIITFGCLEESELAIIQKESDKKITEYLATNNITPLITPLGLKYEEISTNSRAQLPKLGEVLTVKYSMHTLDGAIIADFKEDSTLFQFGSPYLVPYGINYAMNITKKGEKNRFYIPSYLAYGDFNPSDNTFGKNENFIIEMELIDVLSEEEINQLEINLISDYIVANDLESPTPYTSGLYFKTLEAGDGEIAKSDNIATFHYTSMYLDSTVVQQSNKNVPLKVKLNTNLLTKGLKQGLLKMKKGEKSLMIMPSKLAFGSSTPVFPESMREELYSDGLINSQITPYSPILYEVQLIDID